MRTNLGLSIRLITEVKNFFPDLGKLTVTEEVAHLLHVGRNHNGAMVQVPLLFFCFLCQDVAVVGVVALYLASSGQDESLLRAGVSLYFWHNCFF